MKRASTVITHLSKNRQLYTWISVFVLFMLAASRHANLPAAAVITAVTMTPMLILSLLLKMLLIPRFLHRTRWLYYIHSFLVIILLTFIVGAIDIQIYRFIFFNNFLSVPTEVLDSVIDTGSILGRVYLYAKYLILLSITFAVVTVSEMIDERRQLEHETKEQQMQQELRYLRAQINPHFLFNALNCIYSLTISQDEKAPDSVMKLSEMLRYVIDDCRTNEVPVAKEIAYINNYIEFQAIRMENKPNIVFDCSVSNPEYSIPPMLFQPMVENCFKHSRIIDDKSAYIRLKLVQEGEHLVFETENSIHENQFSQTDDERTGIGVNNVRQRLDLIFGANYKFTTEKVDNKYFTKLYI